MEEKSLLKPPSLLSRHVITQNVGSELLLHTFFPAAAKHLQFLARAMYLLVIQPSAISTMVTLYRGSTGLNLKILPAPLLLVHLPCYEVGGMM